ncbi:MAG: hypothetical protein MJ252_05945 [archaeon]|nr:hypothetical protein [archaeon]
MKGAKKQPTPAQKKLSKKEEMERRMREAELERQQKRMQQEEELDNLNKNLLKKLYSDLYMANCDFYNEKNLTFENFLFHFYKDITSMIDYSNPNYQQLLKKVDLKIKTKFEIENKLTADLNRNELAKQMNLLSQEDEWALIYKYKAAKFREQQYKEAEEKRIKKEKYLAELQQQIDEKKTFKSPEEQRKDNVYTYDENEANKRLKELQIENQIKIDGIRRNCQEKGSEVITPDTLNEIENSNLEITQENKDLICKKIKFLESLNPEEEKMMSAMVDQIMAEKKVEKIDNIINTAKYKKELEDQMNYKVRTTERPNKMTPEELKMNKQLLKESREYFGLQNKI